MSEEKKLAQEAGFDGTEPQDERDSSWQNSVFRAVLTESLLSKAETENVLPAEGEVTAEEGQAVELDSAEAATIRAEELSASAPDEEAPLAAPTREGVDAQPGAESGIPPLPPVPEEALVEEQPPEPPQAAERLSKGQELYEWTQALVCAVLAVVLLFTFVVRLIGVDGHSMVPTLQHGDRLLVVTSFLDRDFRAGDIVVARKESFLKDPIVKRVIATGGQTVDIDFGSGSVYVDGQLLNEPYINELTYLEEGTEFPLTVPEGSVFLMGDNRNRSNDSRDSSLGTVDEGYIIGKATVLLFPGKDETTEQRDYSRIGLLNR